MKLDKVVGGADVKRQKPGPSPTPEQAQVPFESFSISSENIPVTYRLAQPVWNAKVQYRPDGDDDSDGPGVGGGYGPTDLPLPSPDLPDDGLLWAPPKPKESKPFDDGDDGPGVGGGYFTRPYQITAQGTLIEEFQAPENTLKEEVAPAEGPSLFQGVSAFERLQSKISQDPVAAQRLELKAVEHYEKQFSQLKTADQFQAQTMRLREQIKAGASLDEVRPQAYALARLATAEVLGKRPFDSQVLGALALQSGNIAQMGTGEGKTLTALMPLYLNALSGQGSHLVTVNEYLAKAGYEELKPAFDHLGVSSGLVLTSDDLAKKREAYQADVTYVSNDTLGFDYLRDRTTTEARLRVQRPLNFALIDEADQVLLDEARVPLIIATAESAESLEQAKLQGQVMREVVAGLEPGEDYRSDRKRNAAFLTEVGQSVVANELGLRELSSSDPNYQAKKAAGLEMRGLLREKARLTEGEADLAPELRTQRGLKKAWSELLGRPTSSPEAGRLAELEKREQELLEVFPGVDLYAPENMHRVGYLQNALEARALFREGRDYTVEKGEVQIVDEFKGRISEGRRFTKGLHQALEIKEGLEPKPENRTWASITYPKLFGQYQGVAGMTGTAKSSASEFRESLGLEVIQIPPNKRPNRKDHEDKIFSTRQEKMEALVADVTKLFEEGVPVLLATRSVEANQELSALLSEREIPHQSLNASDVKTNTPEENQIISQAGQSGVITVATNMAGRGVDIKPEPYNYKALTVKTLEGLKEGKDITISFGPDDQKAVDRVHYWMNLVPEAAEAVASGRIAIVSGEAPTDPERLVLKGQDFPGRKLVVLASERNLDRRIDDQLRGRAGRQGAPGETQFYVSLDDELMRLYSDSDKDKLTKLAEQGKVDKLRDLVDQAQERVQNMQADVRLQTAKNEVVDNHQRQIVWAFRDNWLDSEPRANPAAAPEVEATLQEWMATGFVRGVEQELKDKTVNKANLQEAFAKQAKAMGLEADWKVEVRDYEEKLGKWAQSKIGQLMTERKAEIQEMTGSLGAAPEFALAQTLWQPSTAHLDIAWMDHLEALDSIKQEAQLEAYAQREPEQVYKERAYKAFDEMWKTAKHNYTKDALPALARSLRSK